MTGQGHAAVARLLAGQRRSEHKPPAYAQFELATVTNVAAGAAAGGAALVTVVWRGSTVTLRYVNTYTPTTGDLVLVGFDDNTAYIFGRLVGAPA